MIGQPGFNPRARYLSFDPRKRYLTGARLGQFYPHQLTPAGQLVPYVRPGIVLGYLGQGFDPRARYLTGLKRGRLGYLGYGVPGDPCTVDSDCKSGLTCSAGSGPIGSATCQQSWQTTFPPSLPPIVFTPAQGVIPSPGQVKTAMETTWGSFLDQQFIPGVKNKYVFVGAGALLVISAIVRRRR